MSLSLIEIEQQAAALSAPDRAKLAEFLLESLQEPIADEIAQGWNEEIAQRVEAYEKGSATLYTAEDVFAQAKTIVKQTNKQ